MFVKKKSTIKGAIAIALSLSSITSAHADTTSPMQQSLAEQLGWVASQDNNCGGYYVDQPFTYPVSVEKNNYVEMTSNQSLFSQHGTSVLEGKVSLTRYGQQITANKAYLYRNPTTGKMNAMEVIGNVHLREPNTLVIGKRGRYNLDTQTKSLIDILYRTSVNDTARQIIGPKQVTEEEMQKQRRITSLTAWGKADEFSQTEPRIYELSSASFSTCPPESPAWHVKGSSIILNKITGRGYVTNARIFVKSIPVFYFPYINFSIDHQRKSGFLWPTFGVTSSWGPYLVTPYYWNMAPNYDMTISPALLTKRGLQISDKFRYLTPYSVGDIDISVLPGDQYFSYFQTATKENSLYSQSTNTATQAELNRLLNSSTTRKGLFWRNDSRFNEHWTSHVDFNYAGDDYYLRDFGNLNQVTQNQLPQEGDISYKGENWNFIGRLQTYQTLHPIDETAVQNQYRRAPQLVLNGDYPDRVWGLEYFINNEVTHFDIRNTPGTEANQPIGNRFNVQPGISLPIYRPYFFVNPRFQVALTNYNLYQTADTNTPTSIQRHIPIFDFASGLSFYRDTNWFGDAYMQTLEPQLYYTYIPYRNQNSIPIFDTTVSTLTYDQLFNYNRFTGMDRIGDANQLSLGVTTRLIDQGSGLEKIQVGVGEIVYFANRQVTYCNNESCTDNPFNPNNHRRLSPISGLLKYHVSDIWNLETNAIWNPIYNQLDNSTTAVHYQPDARKIINLGYSFVRNGDPLSGINVNSSKNNLKLTTISFSWPVPMVRDINAVGLWSENWNQVHLQNMLYGLQYDTCCWAVRLVGGKAYLGINPNNNNKPKYNGEVYIQFALKGLGNIGSGNPNGLLSAITGYNTQFGQEL